MRISITRNFRMISTGFWHARMRLVSLISLPSASSLALLMRQKRLQRRITMSGFRLAFTRMKPRMNQTQRIQTPFGRLQTIPNVLRLAKPDLIIFMIMPPRSSRPTVFGRRSPLRVNLIYQSLSMHVMLMTIWRLFLKMRWRRGRSVASCIVSARAQIWHGAPLPSGFISAFQAF